ncbi:MAG: DUF262 domain-containing protein [Sphingobacteriales bacterium]|nr:MAG: DUF262 domain-containing protein [Sphingobacteriales bacterium]
MKAKSTHNEGALLKELSQERKNIKTDGYSMSIGELINLYKDDELELDPAYQRLFRWDDEQKSKFIESILLGIPIPPIFVAQKQGGVWSIVDGVQRISTILQLTAELKGYDPLKLTTTKKLPSLEGFDWTTLPDEIKRILRRSKLGVNIILTENSIQAQYELFQRLNTGGLHLEPQEIRNCLIIMLNTGFYDKINELKNYPSFIETLPLQDERFKIEFHMELILRYFIAKYGKVDFSKYKRANILLSEFIDAETTNLIEDKSFDLDTEIKIFKKTFDWLASTLKGNAFKKYNFEKKVFEGQFLASSFEAITPGVAQNINKVNKMTPRAFVNKIKEMYENEEYLTHSARGIKAVPRIQGLTAFSKRFFQI